MEQLRKLAIAEQEFQRRQVRRQVGAGSGWVICTLAGELVDVSIEAGAPRDVTLQRLGRQVIDAIDETLVYVGRLRRKEVDECVSKEW
jgi:hypothetical protein